MNPARARAQPRYFFRLESDVYSKSDGLRGTWYARAQRPSICGVGQLAKLTGIRDRARALTRSAIVPSGSRHAKQRASQRLLVDDVADERRTAPSLTNSAGRPRRCRRRRRPRCIRSPVGLSAIDLSVETVSAETPGALKSRPERSVDAISSVARSPPPSARSVASFACCIGLTIMTRAVAALDDGCAATDGCTRARTLPRRELDNGRRSAMISEDPQQPQPRLASSSRSPRPRGCTRGSPAPSPASSSRLRRPSAQLCRAARALASPAARTTTAATRSPSSSKTRSRRWTSPFQAGASWSTGCRWCRPRSTTSCSTCCANSSTRTGSARSSRAASRCRRTRRRGSRSGSLAVRDGGGGEAGAAEGEQLPARPLARVQALASTTTTSTWRSPTRRSSFKPPPYEPSRI